MSEEAADYGERYDAFAVRNYEHGGEKRAEWLRIGVAFPHQNGDGFRVVLHAVPAANNGEIKIVLRRHSSKEDKSESNQ